MVQIYKSITFLLLLAIFQIPFSASAQSENKRVADLELHILSPLQGEEIVGSKIIIKFEAENHGPDDLYKGDTLFVGFLGGTYYMRVLENDFKKGEKLKVFDELLNVDGYNSYGITGYLIEDNTKVQYYGNFLTAPWIDPDSLNNIKSIEFKNVAQASSIEQTEKRQQLRVYPNPVSHNLRLQWPDNITGDYQVRICDITGKLMQEQNITLIAGVSSIPVSSLPGGLYTLTITGITLGTSSYSCQFIKQ